MTHAKSFDQSGLGHTSLRPSYPKELRSSSTWTEMNSQLWKTWISSSATTPKRESLG
ncbi:hypothetical protein RHMOL_Rhmol10G0166100 [Rhododendron molle]|uniref:Uncharacterized protein n=1 Tax=Rhododendron molle TaxID=49168 RepID=A0ACC0M4R9_RHOML|nr:hypothetical protein RHMOL_Rhmol10G0166100 [Rhododendron molle]